MPSEDITKMLESHDKDIGKAKGILARLFRRILADISVNYYRWDTMMEKYLDNPRNRVASNTKERSSARGNLNKELRRTSITWKVFVKGLRFLGMVKVRFEVHATWPNKKTTVHGVDVLLGVEDIEDGEEDDKFSVSDNPLD